MKENKEYVYQFIYNPFIYESSDTTISIHRTIEGAEKAMYEHKARRLKKFEELVEGYEERNAGERRPIFGEDEEWDVVKTEILE